MAKAKRTPYDLDLELLRLYVQLNTWREMQNFTFKQIAILNPQIERLEKKVKAKAATLANRTKEA